MNRRMLILTTICLLFAAGSSWSVRAASDDRAIVVASTTSTQDSGLFGYLLPLVKARTGITVKVIAQGTGQALETARRGDADVVFVHDPDAEARFVAEGFGLERQLVMYNDFLIVGPAADPAGIRDTKTPHKHCRRFTRGSSHLFPAATVPARIRPSCGCGRQRAWTSSPAPGMPGIARWARAWGLP